MSVGHLDHVLIVYSSMEHVTWKLPGPIPICPIPICYNMLSRFYLIPERHGQTDRRTDIIAISISRVSVLTRDKNQRPRAIL